MVRDKYTLYIGCEIHPHLKGMAEHPFLLEYLSCLEFNGISYLAKSCGRSVTPADLELLVDHLFSLIKKVSPQTSLDRGEFVLFPLLC